MPVCPACQADLSSSPEHADAVAECPFCGEALAAASTAAEPLGEGPSVGRRDSRALPGSKLPVESRIEIVEQSPDRLVLHIPAGGKSAAGLGCFALFWNGFMCVFTPPWFFAMKGPGGPPLYVIVPFLLVFWSIGLGMAYAWLRMKFTRSFLLLEPQRMALQTRFLRRDKLEEAPLTDDSRARLIESYQVNNVPVYRVQVNGAGHTFKFATHLTDPEKEWIAATINSFLRVPKDELTRERPNFCWSCGGTLADVFADESATDDQPLRCPHCNEAQPELPPPRSTELTRLALDLPLERQRFRHLSAAGLRPRDLPAESTVQIDEEQPDRLAFSLPLLPNGKLRRGLSIGIMMFGLLWLGLSGYELWKVLQLPRRQALDWLPVVFNTLPTLPGLLALWTGFNLSRARIRVSLDQDWFRVRYGIGLLGKTKRFATSSIDAVRLRWTDENGNLKPSTGRSMRADHEAFVVATVHCGRSFLPLTTLHPRVDAETAAGLVKHQLEEFGHSFPN